MVWLELIANSLMPPERNRVCDEIFINYLWSTLSILQDWAIN